MSILVFASNNFDKKDGSLMSFFSVQASFSETPGLQLSAPSLTLSVSGLQVTGGLFLVLVCTLTSKLTTDDPIAPKRGASVDNL